MGQNKPTPSFNTVKKSNRQARIKRIRAGRVVLLAIFAVLALLLLSCLVFCVCSIVDHFVDDKPNPSDNLPELAYQTITQPHSAIYKGTLVNVNEDHEYRFPSSTSDLKNIYDNRVKYENVSNTYLVGNPAWLLGAAALDAFNTMMLKHYELSDGDGSIKISSAYRSYEDQANSTSSSTPAGHSDHHTGLCIALRPNDGSYLEETHWIYQNCHKYGFVIRYPDSKSEITGVSGYEYCIRYVGVEHATYMVENDLCLEEYTALLKKSYPQEKSLQINAADGHKYAVYYVAAGSDITTFEVPKNYVYSISGDNIGGFIVTVHLDEPKNA